MPAGGQELVGGLDQVLSGASQQLRLRQQNQSALRQHGPYRHQVVDQGRQEGFHAFYRNGLGDGLQHVIGVGNVPDQGTCAGADLVGQLQLAAGRRPYPVQVGTVGALVGGVEAADGVHLVAEELDAHRVGHGGDKDIQDATSDSKLAALHDQVHPGVGVADQSFDRLVQGQLLAAQKDQRLHILQALDHGLQQGAHGHDQDADGSKIRIVLDRMGQSPEDGYPGGHGVCSGREPLMRQGLPRAQQSHVARVSLIPGADGAGHLLGVTLGRDHQNNRCPSGCCGGQGWPDALGSLDHKGGVGVGRGPGVSLDQSGEGSICLQVVQKRTKRPVQRFLGFRLLCMLIDH